MYVLEHRVASFRSGRGGWPFRRDARLKPERCALAGWVHEPQPDSRDHTVCFLCGKALANWTAKKDDPFQQHILNAPHCVWAALMCVRRGQLPDVDTLVDVVETYRSGKPVRMSWYSVSKVDEALFMDWIRAMQEEDVDALIEEALTGQSERMEAWRYQSFSSAWPYDREEGSKLTRRHMAKAGFIYFPGPSSEDGVVCVYCGVGLDGWESNDDPV
jgi:hypothetical protein